MIILRYPRLLVLAVALGFTFLGYNAAEQFLTSFYGTTGKIFTAFNSLAILYGTGMVGAFLGPTIVRKFGIKIPLVFGLLAYALTVFAFALQKPLLCFVFPLFMGLTGNAGGVAQIDLLRLTAPPEKRGELWGAINVVRTVGGASGILVVGLLLRQFAPQYIYFVLGTVMLLAPLTLVVFLHNPEETEREPAIPIVTTLRKTVTMMGNGRLHLIVPFLVVNGFILGLVLGAIPAAFSQKLGIGNIGIPMTFFHLTLAVAGFYGGRLSDFKGRYAVLYGSLVPAAIAILLVLSGRSVPILMGAMISAGVFSASAGITLEALFIDLFGKGVKEAFAAAGILGGFLGIVPAFLLSKYLATDTLLYVALGLCGVAAITTGILARKTKEEARK